MEECRFNGWKSSESYIFIFSLSRQLRTVRFHASLDFDCECGLMFSISKANVDAWCFGNVFSHSSMVAPHRNIKALPCTEKKKKSSNGAYGEQKANFHWWRRQLNGDSSMNFVNFVILEATKWFSFPSFETFFFLIYDPINFFILNICDTNES